MKSYCQIPATINAGGILGELGDSVRTFFSVSESLTELPTDMFNSPSSFSWSGNSPFKELSRLSGPSLSDILFLFLLQINMNSNVVFSGILDEIEKKNQLVPHMHIDKKLYHEDITNFFHIEFIYKK